MIETSKIPGPTDSEAAAVYETMKMGADVLPEYDDPKIANKLSPHSENFKKTIRLYFDREEFTEIDWEAVKKNINLFNNLINDLEDNNEEKNAEIKRKVKDLFGKNNVVKSSAAISKSKDDSLSSELPQNSTRELISSKISKFLKPINANKRFGNKKKNVKEKHFDDISTNNDQLELLIMKSDELKKKKQSKNKRQTKENKRKNSIKIILHMEDCSLHLVYKKIKIGYSVWANNKIYFLAAIEERDKETGITIKPSIINKVLHLEIPTKKLFIKLKPVIFMFDISKKYKCTIFLINKIITKEKKKVSDNSLSQENQQDENKQ